MAIAGRGWARFAAFAVFGLFGLFALACSDSGSDPRHGEGNAGAGGASGNGAAGLDGAGMVGHAGAGAPQGVGNVLPATTTPFMRDDTASGRRDSQHLPRRLLRLRDRARLSARALPGR